MMGSDEVDKGNEHPLSIYDPNPFSRKPVAEIQMEYAGSPNWSESNRGGEKCVGFSYIYISYILDPRSFPEYIRV